MLTACAKEGYPPAPKDYIKHVIPIPSNYKEDSQQLALVVGKTLLVDCNHHNLVGKVEEKALKGSQEHYYTVEIEEGRMMSTRMGCPPPKKEKFVTLGGRKYIINNSPNKPIVVYAHKSLKVDYKIIDK